jgi:hypothetical protein
LERSVQAAWRQARTFVGREAAASEPKRRAAGQKLKRITVDSFEQPNVLTFPIDAKLYAAISED